MTSREHGRSKDLKVQKYLYRSMELKVAWNLKGPRSSHGSWPMKAQPFQSRRQILKANNHRNDPERTMHNLQSNFKYTSPSLLIL